MPHFPKDWWENSFKSTNTGLQDNFNSVKAYFWCILSVKILRLYSPLFSGFYRGTVRVTNTSLSFLCIFVVRFHDHVSGSWCQWFIRDSGWNDDGVGNACHRNFGHLPTWAELWGRRLLVLLQKESWRQNRWTCQPHCKVKTCSLPFQYLGLLCLNTINYYMYGVLCVGLGRLMERNYDHEKNSNNELALTAQP